MLMLCSLDSLRSMSTTSLLLGASLGSGVGTYVAFQRPVSISASNTFSIVSRECRPKSNFLLSYLDLTERQVLISASRAKAIDQKY